MEGGGTSTTGVEIERWIGGRCVHRSRQGVEKREGIGGGRRRGENEKFTGFVPPSMTRMVLGSVYVSQERWETRATAFYYADIGFHGIDDDEPRDP